MLRRSLSASLVLFVLGGFVIAGTYNGAVTKLEDGKVTVRVKMKGDEKATEKTFKISKDVKFIKAKTKDSDETELKVEDVKEMIAKAAEKGEKGGKRGGRGGFAKIETTGEGDDETVTKITFGGGRGKGKGGKKKDE